MVAALNRVGGTRAEVLTTDADGPHRRLTPDKIPTDIPIHLFKRSISEQWKVSLGLWNWLRRNVRHYDIVHIHAIWSFATVAASRAAERCNVPYIIRPAGMLSSYSWQQSSWKKRAYWNCLERRTIQNAAAFHATSEPERSEIHSVCPEAHVFTIPNGVDDSAFCVPRNGDLLRRRCQIMNENLPIVVCLSRLHPKKGIVDLLLPAAAESSYPYILVIAGANDPRTPNHDRDIRDAIKRFGLENRVQMLGFVPPSERWSIYDGADAFVLPSQSENFGVVVAEAMARSCPVVVTDAVQSCSHVAAAEAGEVVHCDVDALAQALDRIVSDAARRQRYGEAGRKYAEQHFRWDRIAPKICAMYDRCLSATDVAGASS
jgi:glycosyltransferase involved in cell wall biosynthesis